MVRFSNSISLLIGAILLTAVASESSANDTGELAYTAKCASCHGSKAEGNTTLNAPALAAQQASYVVRQIGHFNSQTRGKQDTYAMQMAAISSTINDEQAEQIASYVSQLPPATAARSDGDPAQGYKYYQSSCGGCHGGKAEGNQSLNSPRLAGIDSAYLQRQYSYFLNGKRGSDKSDRFGRQMVMIANTLTDKEKIEDVFAYISSLTPEGAE